MIVSRLVVSRGEKILSSGTDPESYITEHTLEHDDHGYDLYERIYEVPLSASDEHRNTLKEHLKTGVPRS